MYKYIDNLQLIIDNYYQNATTATFIHNIYLPIGNYQLSIVNSNTGPPTNVSFVQLVYVRTDFPVLSTAVRLKSPLEGTLA